MFRIGRHGVSFGIDIDPVRFRHVLRRCLYYRRGDTERSHVGKSVDLLVCVAVVIRDSWGGARRGLDGPYVGEAASRQSSPVGESGRSVAWRVRCLRP